MSKRTRKSWSAEHRQKQAEAIRRWKPWKKSTGPRTVEGKNASRLNALKHGMHSAAGVEIAEALRHQQAFLALVSRLISQDVLDLYRRNELYKPSDKSKR